jgi:hypothetical protein
LKFEPASCSMGWGPRARLGKHEAVCVLWVSGVWVTSGRENMGQLMSGAVWGG